MKCKVIERVKCEISAFSFEQHLFCSINRVQVIHASSVSFYDD